MKCLESRWKLVFKQNTTFYSKISHLLPVSSWPVHHMSSQENSLLLAFEDIQKSHLLGNKSESIIECSQCLEEEKKTDPRAVRRAFPSPLASLSLLCWCHSSLAPFFFLSSSGIKPNVKGCRRRSYHRQNVFTLKIFISARIYANVWIVSGRRELIYWPRSSFQMYFVITDCEKLQKDKHDISLLNAVGRAGLNSQRRKPQQPPGGARSTQITAPPRFYAAYRSQKNLFYFRWSINLAKVFFFLFKSHREVFVMFQIFK